MATPWPTVTPPNPTSISKIAFQGCKEGYCDIFIVNPDGSNLVNLTQGLGPDGFQTAPQWSPDGKRIYFLGPHRQSEASKEALYSIDLNGANLKYLFDITYEVGRYDISPDGEWVLYGSFLGKNAAHLVACAIFKTRIDGSERVRLTASEHSKTNPYQFCDYSPSWSPDGQWISFTSDRDDPIVDDIRDTDLYTMRSDGSELTRLTDKYWHIGSTRWSPDGKEIALVANEVEDVDSVSNLYLLSVDNRSLRQINQGNVSYRHTSIDYLPPAWSPDSQQLVVELGWPTKQMIGLIDATTGQETLPLVQGFKRLENPDWSPWLPESINQAPTPIPFDQIDTDGDGIPDIDEGEWDQDNDGLPNYKDLDSDGDGILDKDEIKTTPQSRQQDKQPRYSQTKFRDTDDDAIPDFMDEDSDQDGLSDAQEYSTGQADPLMECTVSNSICFNNDVDGDGQLNYLDDDTDGDGEPDFFEVMTVMRNRAGELPWWLNPEPFFMVGKIQGHIYLPLIVK